MLTSALVSETRHHAGVSLRTTAAISSAEKQITPAFGDKYFELAGVGVGLFFMPQQRHAHDHQADLLARTENFVVVSSARRAGS